jgi:hypothetical protein
MPFEPRHVTTHSERVLVGDVDYTPTVGPGQAMVDVDPLGSDGEGVVLRDEILALRGELGRSRSGVRSPARCAV